MKRDIMILGILAFLIVAAGLITYVMLPGPVGNVEDRGEQIIKEELVREIETIPPAPSEELIQLGGDENIRVVTIKAWEEENKWHFPIQEYEDEFIDVGLHSDAFIQFDGNQIELLEDSEAIWLTPMIKSDNKTVLFNAIYSHDIANCGSEKVKIMGKEYDLSSLRNGSAFENDDKWKVVLDYDGACLKRIVIYLDGYFYDLEDNDQINLFRNDNTVLFKFENLEEKPKIKLIITKPSTS